MSHDEVVTVQPTGGTNKMDKDLSAEEGLLQNEQADMTRNAVVDDAKIEVEKKRRRTEPDDYCCCNGDGDEILLNFLLCRWITHCFISCCRGLGDGCCCGSGNHIGDSGDQIGNSGDCCGDCGDGHNCDCDCGDCDCGDCDCGGCDCGDCNCFS